MIRGIDEELQAPKYAHIERERRFLVDPARRPDLDGRPHILIEDRYIDGTRLRLRRMTEWPGGRIVLKLGKKYGGDPLAQPCVTTYLNDAEYVMLAALPAHCLVKRRYALGAFSIDVFERALAGLMLAESEQPDAVAIAALAAPDWALAEVSGDPRYEGGTLARTASAIIPPRMPA